MLVQALSIGHGIEVNSAVVGSVHSVFSHAVNIKARGDLWTLLSEERADLPFGIRVPWRSFDMLGLCRGDAVHAKSGFVSITPRKGLVIDCRAAPRWTPRRAGSVAPGLDERLTVVVAASQGAWHGSAAMAATVVAALGDKDALRDALSRVIGRGSGATPAGDDVVIGILAMLTSPLGGRAGAEAACSLRDAMAPLLAGTTDISAHLLRQAASGCVGRRVHELILALIEDPKLPSLRARVHDVLETGATSGADLCAGLVACARVLLLTREEKVAA